jgi:hypothetical protein
MKGFQLIENLVQDPTFQPNLPLSKLVKFNETVVQRVETVPTILENTCVKPACIMDCPIEEDVINIPVLECCHREEMECLKVMVSELMNKECCKKEEPCKTEEESVACPDEDACQGSQPTTPCSEGWFEYAIEACPKSSCYNEIAMESFWQQK